VPDSELADSHDSVAAVTAPVAPVARVDPFAVTLRPDVTQAAAWALVGAVTVALLGFVVSRANSPFWGSALLIVCVGVTGLFALQVFLPRSWTLHLDRDGIHGHLAGGEISREFTDVRALTVEKIVGEPVLSLHTTTGRERMLLPIGCDLGSVRRLASAIDRERASGASVAASAPRPPVAP
jgi:hypothetical protein